MTCGIYAILNKVNSKKYVGKSLNIEHRWRNHLSMLRRNPRPKDCNRYLYSAFKKYGEDSFVLEYLEVFDEPDDDVLYEAELKWMDSLKSCNRDHGYNLRRDSETRCVVHEDTRTLMSEMFSGQNNPNYGNKWTEEQKKAASEIAKRLHAEGRYSGEETRRKKSENTSRLWRENPDKLESMRAKVSEAKTEYKFEQYTKDGKLVRTWSSMKEILDENPDYKRSPIYSCCDGNKKSYRGFIWKKICLRYSPA